MNKIIIKIKVNLFFYFFTTRHDAQKTKMNRIVEVNVNPPEINKVLNEIFTSEYEKLLQYEYRLLNDDTMSYLVKYYTSKAIHHVIEEDIYNKVYSIYNRTTSYSFMSSYNFLYDVVIQAIDFNNSNSDIINMKYVLEEVIDILRNEKRNEKKEIMKSDIDKAINKVNNNYKNKINEIEMEYQRNMKRLKMNEWIYTEQT